MIAKNRRGLIIAASALFLVIAFFTNPGQGSHLRAIKEVVTLRAPTAEGTLAAMSVVHYNNYIVFSTATFGDRTLSYGYFGQIQTTEDIKILWGVL